LIWKNVIDEGDKDKEAGIVLLFYKLNTTFKFHSIQVQSTWIRKIFINHEQVLSRNENCMRKPFSLFLSWNFLYKKVQIAYEVKAAAFSPGSTW
jgi:hypothetical protein